VCIGFKCSVIFTHDEIKFKEKILKSYEWTKIPFEDDDDKEEKKNIERYVTHLMNH